jgi:hypothetical protein
MSAPWCTNLIFFFSYCAYQCGWQLEFIFFPFFNLDLNFCFGTFLLFVPPIQFFFAFKNFAPNHLLSPTYPTHPHNLFIYTIKFKIDSLPPTYSPIYLKCDTFIPTYLTSIHLFTYLPTHILTYMSFHLLTY